MRQLRNFIPELFVQFNISSLHGAGSTEALYYKVYTVLTLCGRYTWCSLVEDEKTKSRSFPTAILGQQMLPSAKFEVSAPKGRSKLSKLLTENSTACVGYVGSEYAIGREGRVCATNAIALLAELLQKSGLAKKP